MSNHLRIFETHHQRLTCKNSFLQRIQRTYKFIALLFSTLAIATLSTFANVAVAQPGDTNSTYCPAYGSSPIYRQRSSQITVGPNDNWQATIAGAGPDTEVLLLDGDYNLTQYAVVLDSSNVTVRGASGNRDAVRIVGQGYGPGSEGFMVFGRDVTIADLTMSNIRNHAVSIKPEGGAGGTHVYNVHLFDIGTQHIKGSAGAEDIGGVVACSKLGYTPGGVQGDYLGAIDIHNAVDWIVRDNYIYNINGDGTGCNVDTECGTYIYGAPSIYLWRNSRGSIVERNTIVDSDRGIALGLGSGHDGGVIRNNFIYRPAAGDAGIELWTASNLLVEHNTVILGGNYPGAIEFLNSNNITVRNNLISVTPFDKGGNNGISYAGNITDATVNDLTAAGAPQLRPGSRAIGAGVPSSLTTDIDGDARQGRWDVGADQFADSAPVDPVVTMSSVTVSEAQGTAEITLSLDKAVEPANGSVKALFFTQSNLGSATAGQDFWGFTREVVFAPGETDATVVVTILNDSEPEDTEEIIVRVKPLENVQLARVPLTSTVTIINDD